MSENGVRKPAFGRLVRHGCADRVGHPTLVGGSGIRSRDGRGDPGGHRRQTDGPSSSQHEVHLISTTVSGHVADTCRQIAVCRACTHVSDRTSQWAETTCCVKRRRPASLWQISACQSHICLILLFLPPAGSCFYPSPRRGGRAEGRV